MTETAVSTGTQESVEDFAARARAWLAGNMPRIDPDNPPFSVRADQESWTGPGAPEAVVPGRFRRDLLSA